jgi:vacuolar-type H+-ATPase subunit I/STV1
MSKFRSNLKKFLIFFILIFFSSNIIASAEEEKIDAVIDQLQILAQDLKTLEKAVYKTAEVSSSQGSISANGLNEEILTRHLLKLNEIEEEFRKLTNRFEEVNFKLDNLSSRVTKIQSDTQLRFSDLNSSDNTKQIKKKKYQTG